MKLSSILAAAALLAAPAIATTQAHGAGVAGGRAPAGRAVLAPHPVAAPRPGFARVGFRGRPFDHRGARDRFDRRTIVAPLFPYWGWDCAPGGGCGWDDDAAPGLTPADYADPPRVPAAAGYAPAAWSAPRAETNECSDWVWRARLRHSVCVRPSRG